MALKEPLHGDVGGGPNFLFSSSDGGLVDVVATPTAISSGISVTLLSLPRLDPFLGVNNILIFLMGVAVCWWCFWEGLGFFSIL